jgi:hypothetical protein
MSLAAPFAPTSGDTQYVGGNGAGVDDTFLRSFGTGATIPNQRLFDAPKAPGTNATDPPHPYLLSQIMTKICNNITTRSNVFAVYLTVGFFEVTNDAVQPPTMNAEIGLSNGTNIRHRMFCIVDRTNLSFGQLTTLTGPVNIPNGQAVPGVQTVSLAAVSGTTSPTAPTTAIPWTINPGITLVIDTGNANQESVIVTAVSGNQITANFIRAHNSGASVTIPGNPGPQPFFDPRNPNYAPVIPYFAIIQ